MSNRPHGSEIVMGTHVTLGKPKPFISTPPTGWDDCRLQRRSRATGKCTSELDSSPPHAWPEDQIRPSIVRKRVRTLPLNQVCGTSIPTQFRVFMVLPRLPLLCSSIIYTVALQPPIYSNPVSPLWVRLSNMYSISKARCAAVRNAGTLGSLSGESWSTFVKFKGFDILSGVLPRSHLINHSPTFSIVYDFPQWHYLKV